MGLRFLPRGLAGGAICVLLLGYSHVSAEPGRDVTWGQALTGTETSSGQRGGEGEARQDRVDGIPLEWVEEILENRELLESLEMIGQLELFEEDNRFSSHRFE